MDQNLYQENIIDHANNPRNKRVISDCTCSAKGDNPSCGDTGEIFLKIDKKDNDKDSKVLDASFDGVGCAISQASLSMMTEFLINRNMQEIKMIMPGDIYKMLGVTITPARVNCALLSYRALEQAIIKYDTMVK